MRGFIQTTVISVLYCTAALAAPVDKHIRGEIVSVSADNVVVHTSSGTNVSIALNGGTHYLQVERSSLDKIESGSYIGTPTKDIGSTQVALAVMIFPAALRGAKAGHFPYDRLPDTTVSSKTTVTSMMTNGSVSAVASPAAGDVNTTMTNGSVSASASSNGVKQLTITYPGGQQTVLVPPATPIVNLVPGTELDLSNGAYVFVDATENGSSLTAGLVMAGVGGLKPPF
jgi:hypothetical protein